MDVSILAAAATFLCVGLPVAAFLHAWLPEQEQK